jgi:hypothetical protein
MTLKSGQGIGYIIRVTVGGGAYYYTWMRAPIREFETNVLDKIPAVFSIQSVQIK